MNTSSNRNARWSDLRLRLISAAVIVPVAVFCIVMGGVAYEAMLLLVSLGLVYEGMAMAGVASGRGQYTWRGALLLLWPVVGLVCAIRNEWRAALALMLSAVVFGPAQWASVAVASLGGLSLLWLREPSFGAVVVLFIVAVVIASDSGAYISGRIFGGPKLAPRISPGKTRSGALGGLVCAGLAGMAIAVFFGSGTPLGGLIWGMILGCASQSGDLAESAAKRRVGIKDSGKLIPGHGGLLDRFDGLLAAAPLAALVSLCVPGQVFWKTRPDDILTAFLHFFVSP
ncbi:phosphatidate cytidylyltransferase [Asaia lannensis]|uniref:Phosphatidate cytidylyltransferase n=1 Tax=Asaia lannensis NBRC 102526 TaxID=1307926 RepID=A0ABT1CE83_9PROT|nr:phosphatidate cytidylyltransferase [Asaia lannensis]MCO6159161.1 phosphatidate cytidylyltransferase [Asaia lannensis NBRC 102526]GBQ97028.1 phosphatidate cytidylyltransferase [Asaia lannensis NBRC 102526]